MLSLPHELQVQVIKKSEKKKKRKEFLPLVKTYCKNFGIKLAPYLYARLRQPKTNKWIDNFRSILKLILKIW